MTEFTAKIGESGRLVIPAPLRKALGIEPGDEVVMRLESDELRVMTLDQAVARAMAGVRRYTHGKGGLTDQIIEDRRREAARDDGGP